MTNALDPAKVAELESLRAKYNALDKRIKEIRKDIDGYFRNFTAPNSHDVPSELLTHNGVTYQTEWLRQDRSKLNTDKLESYLKEKGMWEELSKETRVLDEEKLGQAVEEGLIEPSELSECMDEKIIRQVIIKVIK